MRHYLYPAVAASVLLGGIAADARTPERPGPLGASEAEEICTPFFEEEGDYGPAHAMAAAFKRTQSAAGAAPPAPPTAPPPLTAPNASMARPMPYPMPGAENRERYDGQPVAGVLAVADQPVSTFSVDVDTGSYSNVRRMLRDGGTPPRAAVRSEEMVNYFRYDYPAPKDRDIPFTVSADVTTTPWNEDTRLLRIGLRGYDIDRAERPAANLVFLVDVSGSMWSRDKLPLAKCAMALTARQMKAGDRISIVTYAGTTRTVLEGASDPDRIVAVLSDLTAGGSTAGAAGISLAYDAARANMITGGINRILLATDGDFNVGTTNRDQLVEMVEREREAGVSLTTLGFGTGNYNEAMMEQIADHGNGNYAYIDSPMEAERALVTELDSTLFTIAKDVKIQVEFNPAHVSEYRLIGYENRALAEEDFDNDAVDAGEIGAGHQVTAIYEIVPRGTKGWLPERRYEANRREEARSGEGAEMAFLRLRYKLPGEDQSRLIERPVGASALRNAKAPEGDMAFATAVAAFGQKLRGDKYLGDYGYDAITRLARRGGTGDYWRGEFLTLVDRAATLDQDREADRMSEE